MIYEPDHVLILDASLFEEIDVTAGLKSGGWIVVNTEKPPYFFKGLQNYHVATVDGSQIAVSLGLGSQVSPVVNTAMLGAFAKATGLIQIDSIMKGIREEISQNAEANMRAAMKTFQEVRLH